MAVRAGRLLAIAIVVAPINLARRSFSQAGLLIVRAFRVSASVPRRRLLFSPLLLPFDRRMRVLLT